MRRRVVLTHMLEENTSWPPKHPNRFESIPVCILEQHVFLFWWKQVDITRVVSSKAVCNRVTDLQEFDANWVFEQAKKNWLDQDV